MRRDIGVFLGEDTQVGTIRSDAQGARESASFEYVGTWLASPDAFSIAPGLPRVSGPQFHKRTRDGSVFHGPIADTEPDGWGRAVILRDHAKRRQQAKRSGEVAPVHVLGGLEILLCVDDVSRVGALRFKDERGEFCRAHDEDDRAIPPLIELGALLSATRAFELNAETAADLAYLKGRGTSLGGLRPKCSVVDDDGQLSIGKFPSIQDQRPVTKGEVLALQLAKLAGIDVAEARLVYSDDVPVALIRRFDRNGDRRELYISAATMLGVEPTEPGDHTYTEIVDAIRRHGSSVQSDIEELFRRIAFSILITNVDDHLKNHGFLHVQRDQWRLSPAFDLNPFPDRARELKTWISEDTGPEATIDALLSVAPYFRLTQARARAVVAAVNRAVARWREIGSKIGMSRTELSQFDDAFEHAERVRAR